MKDKLTAWSLKVAEDEHQFTVIDGTQKTFVVREMMLKDIKREFFTEPRQFDEIMEKLEISVDDRIADDGHWETVARTMQKTTQRDSDTSNDMSHDDVCAIA